LASIKLQKHEILDFTGILKYLFLQTGQLVTPHIQRQCQNNHLQSTVLTEVVINAM